MIPIHNYWTVPRSYTFGVPTFYTPHHLGVDLIVRTGNRIVAPKDGFMRPQWGEEGGYQAHLITDTLHFRFLHLSRYGKRGWVKEGEVIGYSGNSGLSSGSHIHYDICDLTKGAFDINHFERFIDPDVFHKEKRYIKGETSGITYVIEDGVRHAVNTSVEAELVPENVIQSFPEGEPYFV